MVPDGAASGRANQPVVARNVTTDAAHGSTFQATLGFTERWKEGHGRGRNEEESSQLHIIPSQDVGEEVDTNQDYCRDTEDPTKKVLAHDALLKEVEE